MVKAKDLWSNAAKKKDSDGTSPELDYLPVDTSDRVQAAGFKAPLTLVRTRLLAGKEVEAQVGCWTGADAARARGHACEHREVLAARRGLAVERRRGQPARGPLPHRGGPNADHGGGSGHRSAGSCGPRNTSIVARLRQTCGMDERAKDHGWIEPAAPDIKGAAA